MTESAITTKSAEILSDITTFTKYAKYIPEIGRRETWEELVERNMAMHINKYPKMKKEIQQVYKDFVMTKKVLPSMRSLQFGGKPIQNSPNRSLTVPTCRWITRIALQRRCFCCWVVQA